MFKIMKEKAPIYLKKIDSNKSIREDKDKPCNNIPLSNRLFQTFFFSFCFTFALNNWFKLYVTIRNSESIAMFKSRLQSFVRPVPNIAHNTFDPIGLKLLTHLRLGFSHLNEYRFRYYFQDCMNPLCSCRLEIENTLHYLLHCHHFSHSRVVLMNSVKSVSEHFNSLSDSVKKYVPLYGDPRLDENKNYFRGDIILKVLKGSLDPYLIKNSLSKITHL